MAHILEMFPAVSFRQLLAKQKQQCCEDLIWKLLQCGRSVLEASLLDFQYKIVLISWYSWDLVRE